MNIDRATLRDWLRRAFIHGLVEGMDFYKAPDSAQVNQLFGEFIEGADITIRQALMEDTNE